MHMRGRRDRGFTLIELLIVVAIVGIIAAVAIPNLLNAVDKGKQKRSMMDMRSICTAIEAYSTDMATYPKAIGSWLAVKPLLNPYFIENPPDNDGWNNMWEAGTDASGSDYTVASLGKDGITSGRPGGATMDFNCDIVYTNGSFFQWPEGQQN